MKITVATQEFKKALAKVIGVIEGKVQIPVLANVRLDVSGTTLVVTGCNLNESIIAILPLAGADVPTGTLLVPAHRLNEILSASTAETTTFQQDGEKLHIKTGKYVAKVRNESPSTFPTIPTAPEAKLFLNLNTLKALIEKVEAAIPNKEGRFAQSVLQIERTGQKLTAVATDGYRIAVATAEEVSQGGDFTQILTKSILPVIKNMAGDVISLGESENNYFYSATGLLAVTNKPQQKFPDYKKAYGQQYKSVITVTADDLGSSLARLLAVVDKENPKVVFSFDISAAEMHLTSKNTENEEAEDFVGIELDSTLNAPNAARLNPKFVQDFLAKTSGKIHVQFVNERALVRFTNGTNFETFIMPLRDSDAKPAEEKK